MFPRQFPFLNCRGSWVKPLLTVWPISVSNVANLGPTWWRWPGGSACFQFLQILYISIQYSSKWYLDQFFFFFPKRVIFVIWTICPHTLMIKVLLYCTEGKSYIYILEQHFGSSLTNIRCLTCSLLINDTSWIKCFLVNRF